MLANPIVKNHSLNRTLVLYQTVLAHMKNTPKEGKSHDKDLTIHIMCSVNNINASEIITRL